MAAIGVISYLDVVLVVEVVAVLPHVECQQGREAGGERRASVDCVHDRPLALVAHEPSPSGAEGGMREGRELLFELVEAAKLCVEHFDDLSVLQRRAVGCDTLEEEVVVVDLRRREMSIHEERERERESKRERSVGKSCW